MQIEQFSLKGAALLVELNMLLTQQLLDESILYNSTNLTIAKKLYCNDARREQVGYLLLFSRKQFVLNSLEVSQSIYNFQEKMFSFVFAQRVICCL